MDSCTFLMHCNESITAINLCHCVPKAVTGVIPRNYLESVLSNETGREASVGLTEAGSSGNYIIWPIIVIIWLYCHRCACCIWLFKVRMCMKMHKAHWRFEPCAIIVMFRGSHFVV